MKTLKPKRSWMSFTRIESFFELQVDDQNTKNLLDTLKVEPTVRDDLVKDVRLFYCYRDVSKRLVMADAGIPQILTENGILAVSTQYYMYSSKLIVIV